MKPIKIVEIPIDDIYPYPENNRINDDTVEALQKLIVRVGFNVPLVIDAQGVIVKGHARHRAGKALGYKTLPCIISSNSDAENDKDRYVDNKISELSKWDKDKLQYEIESIDVQLREVGIEFRAMNTNTRDVNSADILQATEQQQFEDGEKDVQALLSVCCPKCGGFFEYKVKSY